MSNSKPQNIDSLNMFTATVTVVEYQITGLQNRFCDSDVNLRVFIDNIIVRQRLVQ